MSMTHHQSQPSQSPRTVEFFPEFTADHRNLPYDPDAIATAFNDYIDDHATTLGPDAVAAIVNEHTHATIPSDVVQQTWDRIDDVSKEPPISVLITLMDTHARLATDTDSATTASTQNTTSFFDIVDSTKNAATHVTAFITSKLTPTRTTHVNGTPTVNDEQDS